MNKKEITEVRKTFKVDNCCIDKVCACYVTPDKNKSIIPIDTFNALDEESMVKYLEIFKKSISGTLGKQLNCLTFPNAAEKDGGGQNLLYELESSELEDSTKVEDLFDRIIENYENDGYYCILIMHAKYDVIARASDDAELDSTEVYSHIICSVCPTNLSKAALTYDQEENKIKDSDRVWVLEMPHCAFLFPTFTDRSPNIHEVLFYNKKPSEVNVGIVERVLECSIPLSADEQADAFIQSTQAAFNNNVTFDQISSIHDTLVEQMEISVEDDVTISKETLRTILENENAPDLGAFDDQYKQMLGNKDVFASNIVNKDKFVVKMDGLTITANGSTKNLLSVKEVDGQKCLVISPNGDLDVDGITARLF